MRWSSSFSVKSSPVCLAIFPRPKRRTATGMATSGAPLPVCYHRCLRANLFAESIIFCRAWGQGSDITLEELKNMSWLQILKKVGEEMLEVVVIIAEVAVVILVTLAVAAALIALVEILAAAAEVSAIALAAVLAILAGVTLATAS